MKKLFIYPVIEVKCLSSEDEIMGVFSKSAEMPADVTVVVDDKSTATDDYYACW